MTCVLARMYKIEAQLNLVLTTVISWTLPDHVGGFITILHGVSATSFFLLQTIFIISAFENPHSVDL